VFHLTNGRSNTRESATESRLPHYVVKVKGWCKRPPVPVAMQGACKPNTAARNRWLASYNAIVSLEA